MGEILSYWWLVLPVGLLVAAQWWLMRQSARRVRLPEPHGPGTRVLA